MKRVQPGILQGSSEDGTNSLMDSKVHLRNTETLSTDYKALLK
jgi:hypothetical protein